MDGELPIATGIYLLQLLWHLKIYSGQQQFLSARDLETTFAQSEQGQTTENT
jgi:hypothetical protein